MLLVIVQHYENLSMQYTENFFSLTNRKFHWKTFDGFNILAQNIHGGYTLEPPRRGDSNEYSQCMFWIKNKKIRYTPANPSFFLYILHEHVFLMESIDINFTKCACISCIVLPNCRSSCSWF